MGNNMLTLVDEMKKIELISLISKFLWVLNLWQSFKDDLCSRVEACFE